MMHFKTRPSEKGDYVMYNVWQFIYLKTSVVLIIIICNNFMYASALKHGQSTCLNLFRMRSNSTFAK